MATRIVEPVASTLPAARLLVKRSMFTARCCSDVDQRSGLVLAFHQRHAGADGYFRPAGIRFDLTGVNATAIDQDQRKRHVSAQVLGFCGAQEAHQANRCSECQINSFHISLGNYCLL